MSTNVLVPNPVTEEVIDRLREAIGEEKVLTSVHERAVRAASCSPFPLHQWEEHTPDVVVLPKTTADVVAIVKLANEYRVPVVPRAGASGLADGAVPLHKGIVVDVKNMNEILEIDEENMCVTVQTGVNPLKLNEVLEPLGKFHPDDLAGYANAMFGGRIGCAGWSLLGMGYGHVPDNVISFEIVLPTGDVMWVGEGGTKKIRKSSVGYRFKDLFMQHQGTLGIATTAVLELYPKPEVEFPAFFAYDSFADAHKSAYALATSGLKTLSGVVIFDEYKVEFLRRDDEAWIPLPKEVKAAIATISYGARCEVGGASKRLFEIAKATGGRYLGRELSEGDWASRHDRYHLSYHGRRADGQVVLLSWHCEDSGCTHSSLPDVQKRWHEIVERYVRKYDGVFDDWGMFMYTNNPFKGWGDYLTEIDIGVNELALNDETWAAWLQMKEEISRVTLENESSISACHGGCRPGDVELAMHQELGGGQFELMKKVKRMLDPNNIMNPSKYLLHEAYMD
jgi:glycolate oxidase